jgi:prepilin-type N-terminal cleavage/methylation domain-containing protein
MHCECYSEGSGEVRSYCRLTIGSIFLKKGVTLVELMVVLAIISILAVIAIPGFNGFFSKRTFYCQADELCAMINRARDHAIDKGQPWRVIFIPAEGGWFSFGDANNNNLMDPGEERLGPCHLEAGIGFGSHAHTGPNGTTVPSDGVSFAENRISFSPLGSCNAGTIFLRCREWDLAVRVYPASGTIRRYEYNDVWRELK